MDPSSTGREKYKPHFPARYRHLSAPLKKMGRAACHHAPGLDRFLRTFKVLPQCNRSLSPP